MMRLATLVAPELGGYAGMPGDAGIARLHGRNHGSSKEEEEGSEAKYG
jgi:hypothetical protein